MSLAGAVRLSTRNPYPAGICLLNYPGLRLA